MLYRSNRTFMELKLKLMGRRFEFWDSSNRTFMELKYPTTYNVDYLNSGSNRTFMELKSFPCLILLQFRQF